MAMIMVRKSKMEEDEDGLMMGSTKLEEDKEALMVKIIKGSKMRTP